MGFAGLLLLMAAMAIDSARAVQNLASTSAALRRELRRRDALLDRLRLDIQHSGTVVRDYLLERDDMRAEAQREELQRVQLQINDTLRAYEERLSGSEKQALKPLRTPMDSYWESLSPALRWTSAERRYSGQTFLRNVVVPRRAEIVQLTQQATALNERDLVAGEECLQFVQSRFGRRVGIISLLAIILGLLLAAISIRRIDALGQRARRQYQEMEEARRELASLSARLVNAQEDERRTLSRELHDDLGQMLSAMLIDLRRLNISDKSEVQERLVSVCELAEDCIGKVRNLALMLRPSVLDDLGLVPALRWQARELARRTDLKVKLIADEITASAPDSHRTCIYRVVQEALNNCAKHSKASTVRISVREEEGALLVTVQDDGNGFDPRQEKGMGLLGMEERIEQLGGLFHIESERGRGTVLSIRLSLPVREPAISGRVA